MPGRVKRVLTGNWLEMIDEQGRTYYANRSTRETRWTPPPLDDPATESRPVAPPTASAASGMGGEWREIIDDKTGRPYYYNRQTRETRWERPDAMDGDAEDDARQLSTATGDVITRVGGKGTKWYSATDKASGKTYYIHIDTKETRWDFPAELSTSAGASGGTGFANRDMASTVATIPPNQGTVSTGINVVNGVVQAGVGIFLEQKEVGTPLYIKQIFANSAADRCGKLQLGDELVAVNGERVVGRTPSSLRSVIVGPQGTYCRCTIVRGNTEFDVKLLRGTAESLNALAGRGLELHEELDSVKDSLRLLEGELEEERRKRMAELSLRSEMDNADRSGWKEERKKLLDQLENEQRTRKEAEARERRLLDERVQEALHDRERSVAVDEIASERRRLEELLSIERSRATEFEIAARNKEEQVQRLTEQLRTAQERTQESAVRTSLRQAEEREQGLLRALEQERLRYEEQLRTEQEKRIGEQARRQASEEREQQLLRQLEDERFRWGEALRLEEQRARIAESAKREDAMRDIRTREESLRDQALSTAQKRWEEEREKFEENLREEREKKNHALQREQALLDELKKRNDDKASRDSDVETLKRALMEDRSRNENALWEMSDRLKAETEKRTAAELREAHLVEELRTLRRNPAATTTAGNNNMSATSDPILRAEIEELKNRIAVLTPGLVTPHQDVAPRSSMRGEMPILSRGTERDSLRGTVISGASNVREERDRILIGLDRPQQTHTPQSVPNLVALLTSKLPNTVREAVYALGLIAIDQEGRTSILALPQSVFRLEGLLKSSDTGTVRYAALALGNIAMDASGRKAILGVMGAVEHLAALLRSEDAETVRYAALALGNLVLEEAGRKAVLAYGASVPHLSAQLSSQDKQTVRYATGAIRNIAVEEAGRRAVAANPAALDALRALQASTDAATSRYASAALKNLTLGG